MKSVLVDLIKTNAGPLVFILVAGALCFALPTDKSVEAIYLVIGAALTRVKRTDAK
jgi:hypothetical protein